MDKRILIVDDEQDILKLMKIILEKEGYEVLLASGGTECIEILSEQDMDLIVLDLMMPGLNGWDTLEELARLKKLSNKSVLLSSVAQVDKEMLKRYDSYISGTIDKTDMYNNAKVEVKRALEAI